MADHNGTEAFPLAGGAVEYGHADLQQDDPGDPDAVSRGIPEDRILWVKRSSPVLPAERVVVHSG